MGERPRKPDETEDEHHRRSRAGGIASGIKRRAEKAWREVLEMLQRERAEREERERRRATNEDLLSPDGEPVENN